jgi:aryl-phospho-beta-D-glucosidase BglC (GH1 family)
MTMRRELTTIMVTFLLLMSAFSMKALPANSQASDLPWLKADGRWIVDEGGNLVLLRGADYSGMEYGWFGLTQDDFRRMENWGFDVVRLPIAWSYVEPSEGQYNNSYLDIVDRVIAWCKNSHLYVILDMHQWNWAPKYQGNGLPDWAVTQYSDQEKAKVGFFTDRTIQGKFFSMWQYVANRYKNESTIFAYDIFNEANVDYSLMGEGTFLERLHYFYQMAVDYIREVDSRHAVMVEPPWGGGIKAWTKVNDNNLILSTHLYTEGTWDGKTGYDGDSGKLEADFLLSYNLSLMWHVPLVIGEFGVGSAATKAHEWARDFMNIFDKYLVSDCWWSYGRDDDSFGLLTSKGEEKGNLLSALIRIYPCQFNSPPERVNYDIYMNVSENTWHLEEAGDIVAAFKVPSRMGGNFSVSSNFSSTSFSFDEGTSEVKVMLHGRGGGYVEIGQRPSEYHIGNASPKSIIQEPLFIASLILNIALLLTVIALRYKHKRADRP